MASLTEKAQWAVEFVDLPRAAQAEGARWEAFQLRYLNNQARFSTDNKSRQIAWSFTAALDAVVDGVLNPGTPHIFVSFNLEEATEKIRYVHAVVDAVDAPVRPRILRASQTQVEFENGSRFISHPQRPPRGKARARVYLDEMAHYREGLARQIYTAAVPATTKGDGYIRIGSSPMGASGQFWEIHTEAMRRFPGFVRQDIPWWTVRALCTDVEGARKLAPYMLTAERVALFGTKVLQIIFDNMFLEDFQQEYECAFVDEASAWISWEVIQRNQNENLASWHARSVSEAMTMLDEVHQAALDGHIEPALYGGLDVGRKRDLTELVLVGRTTTQQLPLRLMVSLNQVPFDDQRDCMTEILTRLPVVNTLVDQNGIGMQLAEQLAQTGRAEGVTFTNATKELWAVEARLQAERGHTPLPPSRDLAYQIHSIKKKVTAAKNNVFDTERNEKHHADKFWAWALALWCATQGGGGSWEGLGTLEGYENKWA